MKKNFLEVASGNFFLAIYFFIISYLYLKKVVTLDQYKIFFLTFACLILSICSMLNGIKQRILYYCALGVIIICPFISEDYYKKLFDKSFAEFSTNYLFIISIAVLFISFELIEMEKRKKKKIYESKEVIDDVIDQIKKQGK